MTRTDLQLPHDPLEIAAIMAPWPDEATEVDFAKIQFKATTNEALGKLVHWTQLLNMVVQDGLDLELHVFTDGSWRAKQGLGG